MSAIGVSETNDPDQGGGECISHSHPTMFFGMLTSQFVIIHYLN